MRLWKAFHCSHGSRALEEKPLIKDDDSPPAYDDSIAEIDPKGSRMETFITSNDQAIDQVFREHASAVSSKTITNDKKLRARQEAIVAQVCSNAAVDKICKDVMMEMLPALKEILQEFQRDQSTSEHQMAQWSDDQTGYGTAYGRLAYLAHQRALSKHPAKGNSDFGYGLVAFIYEKLSNNTLARTIVIESQVDSIAVEKASGGLFKLKARYRNAIAGRNLAVMEQISNPAVIEKVCERYRYVYHDFEPALRVTMQRFTDPEVWFVHMSGSHYSDKDRSGYSRAYRRVSAIAREKSAELPSESERSGGDEPLALAFFNRSGMVTNAFHIVASIYDILAEDVAMMYSHENPAEFDSQVDRLKASCDIAIEARSRAVRAGNEIAHSLPTVEIDTATGFIAYRSSQAPRQKISARLGPYSLVKRL